MNAGLPCDRPVLRVLTTEEAEMKSPLFTAAAGVVLAALVWLPSPSAAQQKTVKQCQDEWRANKADNEAKGIKEKDYVAQCRGTAAAPAPAPAQTNVAPPPSAPASKGKTAKECRAEWKENKADNEAKGITEKQYVEQCRTGAVIAAPTPAPTPAPAPGPTLPPARPAPTTTVNTSPPAAPTAPTGAGQYRTEAEAKGRCFAETVVWVNLKSKIYHFAGTKNYGNTKEGAYMCEREAIAQGDRASKTERHP